MRAVLVGDAATLACYEKDEEVMREVRGETICIDVRAGSRSFGHSTAD